MTQRSASAVPRRLGPPKAPIGLGLPRPRRSPGDAVGSLVVHLLILWAIVWVSPLRNLDYQANAGDPSGGKSGGGGGGGGRVQVIALPALAQAAVPPPPPAVLPPVPVPPPVVKPVEEVPVVPTPPAPPDTIKTPGSEAASGAGAGAGTGAGTGTGTGTGSGTGSGNGSGNGSGTGAGDGSGGEGGGARPPEPRQLILPPADVPSTMRGVTISVTFLVGPEGRVDQVRLSPEPDNRGFAKKLEEVMKNYRFRPARGPDGQPVPGTITVQLTF